jgi:hypothetical protein
LANYGGLITLAATEGVMLRFSRTASAFVLHAWYMRMLSAIVVVIIYQAGTAPIQ